MIIIEISGGFFGDWISIASKYRDREERFERESVELRDNRERRGMWEPAARSTVGSVIERTTGVLSPDCSGRFTGGAVWLAGLFPC